MCSFKSLIFTRTSSCGHTLCPSRPPFPTPTPVPSQPGSSLSSHRTAEPRTLHGRQGLTLPLRPAEVSAHSGGSLHVDWPDLPFPGETIRRRRHNTQASQPRVWQLDRKRAGALRPLPLRRRTGRLAGPGLSSSRPQSAPLADHSSNPAAPAPRSVAGPSCTLTGAGSEASSRSQSGPPEETPS